MKYVGCFDRLVMDESFHLFWKHLLSVIDNFKSESRLLNMLPPLCMPAIQEGENGSIFIKFVHYFFSCFF